jgi:hypothetical protein
MVTYLWHSLNCELIPNSGTDAITRLHKLERMRDHLHPEMYEKVKAEIMATV